MAETILRRTFLFVENATGGGGGGATYLFLGRYVCRMTQNCDHNWGKIL